MHKRLFINVIRITAQFGYITYIVLKIQKANVYTLQQQDPNASQNSVAQSACYRQRMF